MRKRGGPVGTTLAVSIALALTACVPSPHTVTPTPEATATPVFASDAQALAAAKAAYEGYLAASDQIGNDGGRDPERISKWVTKAWLPHELKSFSDFGKSGNRLSGRTTYTYFVLERRTQLALNDYEIDTYICVDISESRLRNRAGRDVTPASREDMIPVEAEFLTTNPGQGQLLFGGSRPWPGTNFCS